MEDVGLERVIPSVELHDLEKKVRWWKRWVVGIALCLAGAYLVYFGLILGQSAATDSDKWVTFGDFIGGVMNPIVAFAAFFWLTESVKMTFPSGSRTVIVGAYPLPNR